jgi:RNA polymerase sigma factor (sigma-70 family)
MTQQHVSVTSAVALTSEEKKSVEQMITKTVEGDVSFVYSVSPELLGGIRVQVGDLVLDSTIVAQLKKLKTVEYYLDKLEAKYREPLILYYLEELNYQEIADILHLPTSTVGVRIKRAKTALQKIHQKSNHT